MSGGPAVAASPGMPPADDAAHPPRLDGAVARGPDGQPFARAQRGGFFTVGRTSVDAWLSARPAPIDGLPSSAVRVVRAVSANEGRLEAVNSYDNCFLSAGIFQWTAGPDDQPGELPVLLARFKAASPAAYGECFGRYRLDAIADGNGRGGRLVLDAVALRSAADKAPLRGIAWAYRFWRAGHHEDFRRAQLAMAVDRIGRFLAAPVAGRRLSDWMTSEHAIALVLDEHVNRPGHVPGTLDAALRRHLGDGATVDPAGWGMAEERAALDAYLAARDLTNMTHSRERGVSIAEATQGGRLSGARESFVIA